MSDISRQAVAELTPSEQIARLRAKLKKHQRRSTGPSARLGAGGAIGNGPVIADLLRRIKQLEEQT